MKRHRDKTITSNSPAQVDNTDCHPNIRLSDKYVMPWYQFTKAMKAANNAYYNYHPLCKLTKDQSDRVKEMFDNRYKKPTIEELDNG